MSEYKVRIGNTDGRGHTEWTELSPEASDAYVAAMQALRDMDPTRWVPVSERMPQPFEDVLVWLGETEGMAVAIVDERGCWNNSHDGYMTPDGPTHWMPLPEPPKE